MNKQKVFGFSSKSKVNDPQKQQEKPWLGHPDDHEPTKQVTAENVNP